MNELKKQIRKSQKFQINLQVEAFWQTAPEWCDEMVHCLVSATSLKPSPQPSKKIKTDGDDRQEIISANAANLKK